VHIDCQRARQRLSQVFGTTSPKRGASGVCHADMSDAGAVAQKNDFLPPKWLPVENWSTIDKIYPVFLPFMRETNPQSRHTDHIRAKAQAVSQRVEYCGA